MSTAGPWCPAAPGPSYHADSDGDIRRSWSYCGGMRIRPRGIALGLGIGWAVAVLVTLNHMGNPVDAWCYYGFDQSNPWNPDGCFLYGPPVALVMSGIQSVMSFEVFAMLLRSAEMVVLVAVAGPAVGLALFIPAVAIELNAVNINLLIVGAVLVGFRYPM